MNLQNTNIVYINLDSRQDKRKYIENQLDKLDLSATRMIGIDGNKLNKADKKYWLDPINFKNRLIKPNPKRTLGKVGCMLSHIETLKYAIDNRFKNVLILEDDSYFLLTDNQLKIDVPVDANVIYLCYLVKSNNPSKIISSFTPGVIKIDNFGVILCNAYYFPNLNAMKRVYHTLLSNPFNAIDLMYHRYIQEKMPCYIVYPPLVLQSTEFTSDVTFHGKKNNKVSWTKPYIKYFTEYWSSQ
jgi:GR25 family glycosyltransferase involved in LPS biosynthesis